MRYTLDNMPRVDIRRVGDMNDPYRLFYLTLLIGGKVFSSSMTPINTEEYRDFEWYEKSEYYLKHKQEILNMLNAAIELHERFIMSVKLDRKLRKVRTRNV